MNRREEQEQDRQPVEKWPVREIKSCHRLRSDTYRKYNAMIYPIRISFQRPIDTVSIYNKSSESDSVTASVSRYIT